MSEIIKNIKEISFITKVASAFDKIEKAFNPINESDYGSGNWDTEIKAFLDGETLKGLFYSEDWVYICCDLIASKIASQQLYIAHKEIIDGDEVITTADDHVLNQLIENPNEQQDYYNWMYAQIIDFILMGNNIIWRSRGTNQLYQLPAESIDLVFKNEKLDKYQFYKNDESTGSIATAQFDVKDILHIKRPNPSCVYWGLSPFLPTRKAVLFNRYTSDYLNGFYLKNALPGMALHLEKQVNEDGLLKLLRTFEKAYTGRKNQRRTIVIPKGVRAETLTHNIADQKLVELVSMNREIIINSLRVPKHELSLAETGSLGSEEYKMALRNFWSSTLIPVMKSFEKSYTKFFSKELGEDYLFKFDLSDVEILRDDEFKKAELAEKLLITHTLNEVRAKVYQADPLDGGDKTPSSGGGQPDYFSSFGQQTMAQDEGEDKSITISDKEQRLLKHKDSIDYVMKAQKSDIEKNEEKVIKRLFKIYESMFDQTIPIIKKYIKSEKAKKKELTEKEKKKLESELMAEYNKNLNSWLDGQLDDLSPITVSNFDIAVNPIKFNEVDRASLDAIKQRSEYGMREILRQRAITTFESMSQTKTNEIMRLVEQGIADGSTIDKIALNIADRYTDQSVTIGKAKTIARTEVLTASSIGKAAAVEGVVEVLGEKNVEKMWISMQDEDVRDSHQELDGMSIPYDEAFKDSLYYPRDLRADAGETINCRCDLLIIPKNI